MANEFLNNLLKDYEHKRLLAELDLEKRKKTLYFLFPRLQEIEDELNSFAIATAKSILLNGDNSCLKDFNDKIEVLKKEKKSILISNGYDESYLQPFYECPECHDTGFVEKNGKSVMCGCLRQRLLENLYNNANMSNLRTDNFSTFNANLFSDEVDFSKYGQNISPRQNILNIRDSALYFVEHFDDPSTKNLLFSGNTGLRKKFYV